MQEDQISSQVTNRPKRQGFFSRRLRKWQRRLKTWRTEWQPLLERPIGMVGIAIIVFFALLGLAQPLLMSTVWEKAIYDPITGYDAKVEAHPSTPSRKHLLGTDYNGRDILSQLAFATRTSFGVGIISALMGTAVATAIGMIAAYHGRMVDKVLMTLVDAFIMLPPAVVLLIVGLIIDLSWYQVGLLYGIFAGFGSLALLVKSHALSIMTKQHILAARVAGGGSWRIIRVHVLPNLASLITVNMMFLVTGSVMIEALLSYLDRTQLRLSWGWMIWQTEISIATIGLKWHVLIPPALAIMLFCGAFYLVARTLDEIVNPKLRPR